MAARQKRESHGHDARSPRYATGCGIYWLRGKISKMRCSTYQLEGDNMLRGGTSQRRAAPASRGTVYVNRRGTDLAGRVGAKHVSWKAAPIS